MSIIRPLTRFELLLSLVVVAGCSSSPWNPFGKSCPITFMLDPEEDIRVESPSKITMEFTLRSCDDGPVPGLEEGTHIYLFEDDTEQSSFEAQFNIQSSPQVYEFESLLLLDMSGSIIESGNLPDLIKAAQDFVAETSTGERMAIYTFDGSATIKRVVDFTDDVATLQAGIQRLESYQIVDRSTNLYGATESGLSILEERLERMRSDLSAASLIVFTDGTHQAGTGKPGYPTQETVLTHIEATDVAVFTIGLGGEIDKEVLGAIGRDGFAWANKIEKLPDAFTKLRDFAHSTYILTYCSPARAGDHTLRVQVKWKGMEGSYSYEFNANDFSGGCTVE